MSTVMIAAQGLVVFDVDGTLVDSQHIIVAAMSAAFRSLALEPPPGPMIRRIIGLSLTDAVGRLSPDHTDEVHRALSGAYKTCFAELRGRGDHDEPLFPGAREAMDGLTKAGWLLGLATGKSTRGVDALVERHQLHGYFATMQTADDNPGKPHPAMLRRALAETGINADNAVMVGDTSYDMIMAKNAGFRALGVAWGNHATDELRRAGADAIIEDFAELRAVLAHPVMTVECAPPLS